MLLCAGENDTKKRAEEEEKNEETNKIGRVIRLSVNAIINGRCIER